MNPDYCVSNIHSFFSQQGIEKIRVNVIGRVVHVSHFAELSSPTTLMTTLNKRHLGVSIVDTGAEEEMEKGIFIHATEVDINGPFPL